MGGEPHWHVVEDVDATALEGGAGGGALVRGELGREDGGEDGEAWEEGGEDAEAVEKVEQVLRVDRIAVLLERPNWLHPPQHEEV